MMRCKTVILHYHNHDIVYDGRCSTGKEDRRRRKLEKLYVQVTGNPCRANSVYFSSATRVFFFRISL